MFEVALGALLPVVITLLLGFLAAWHKDFSGKNAVILNRMVLLYALPLLLFAGTISLPRHVLLADIPLALSIAVTMVTTFFIVTLLAYFVFRRDLGTSTLQGLAIGGPAVPFVGVPVLGFLYGGVDASIPVAAASLTMNLIQVPACLVLLSMSSMRAGLRVAPTSFSSHLISAFKEPVVWAPISAVLLVIIGVHLPPAVIRSLKLLGAATGGVALFASGIVLFSQRVSLNWMVVLNVMARNLAIPALLWGAMLALGLPLNAIHVAVVTMAIPTAAITVIFAVEYGIAEKEMASTLLFSTLLSIFTMGIFIWLFGA